MAGMGKCNSGIGDGCILRYDPTCPTCLEGMGMIDGRRLVTVKSFVDWKEVPVPYERNVSLVSRRESSGTDQ